MSLLLHPISYTSSTEPLDADTPQRIVMSNYAGMNGSTTLQRNKLLEFADHSVTHDYWDYILYGWLFTFGSTRTYNFKDASDDPGTGKLTIHGTVNNHANGLEFIGGSGWAETGIAASLLGVDSPPANLGGWSRHSVALTNAFIGSEAGGFFDLFLTDGSDLLTSPVIAAPFEGITISANNIADKLLQRKDGDYEYYENGVFVDDSTEAYVGWGNDSLITLNKYGSTINAMTHVAKYALIVRALDSTRALKLYEGLTALHA